MIFFIKNDDCLITYAYFLKNKSTKVRAGMPSAKILGGETTFKQKNVTTCQFLTKNDVFLIECAYFLKSKNTKRRGGVPSATIQN